jgi:hypothetical protein
MRFNFARSLVLGAIVDQGDGSVRIYPTFHNWYVTIPAENIHMVATEHLGDMSLIVVDFGPKGRLTNEVCVGLEHLDRAQYICRDKDYVPCGEWLVQVGLIKNKEANAAVL